MKTKLLFFFVFIISSFVNGSKAQINVGDSLALVDFYDSTTYQFEWNQNTNWLTKAPVSTWYGITVTNNRVTAINLFSNGIWGQIPESFGNMEMLEHIDFSYNQLLKSFPNSIGKLIHLKTIDIISNWRFYGVIPNTIGNCISLKHINLFGSAARGEILLSLGNLKKLEYLNLADCNISGTIPALFGDLSNLQYLDLHNNDLTGVIPESLGNLIKLEFLNLNTNPLSGSIPSSLGNCRSLRTLSLSFDHLTGNIPPELGNLDSCRSLGLGPNRLTGTIPAELGNLTKLTTLYLGGNKLSGNIPVQLGNLTHLEDLSISYNHLSGEIPLSVLKLKSLRSLLVSNNELTSHSNFYSDRPTNVYEILMDHNRYTFDGIEMLIKQYSYLFNLNYYPQALINIHQHNKYLAISAGGTLSNNTYTWYRVGFPKSIGIKGDSTFRPPVSGRYYATVTNKIAKSLTLYTDTVNYVASFPVSELSITIYPNPARGMLLIKGLDEHKNANISIADMSGIVWMKAVAAKQASFKLNVSKLKPGNYMVYVLQGEMTKAIELIKE